MDSKLASKHIFLSYSHADAQMMVRIRSALESMGVRVWSDEGLIPGTESWKTTIESKICDALGIVVLLSPSANRSEWVERELDYASVHKVKIFPVLVRGEPSESIPIELINAQWTDVRDEANFAYQMQKLVLALTEKPGVSREVPEHPQPKYPSTPSRPSKSTKNLTILFSVIIGICLVCATMLTIMFGPKMIEAVIGAGAPPNPPLLPSPTTASSPTTAPPSTTAPPPTDTQTTPPSFTPPPPPTSYYTYEVDYGSRIEIVGGGGEGGYEMNISCPNGYVATGLIGEFGDYIDRIGLQCSWLEQNGTTGDIYTSETRGDSEGTEFSNVCPANQFLVAIVGGAGLYVDRVGGHCESIDGSNSFDTASVGGSGGNPLNAKCPAGYVVTGLQGGAGVWVDHVNIVCNKINKIRH